MPTTETIESARASRLAAIQATEHARSDALEALMLAATLYVDAARQHGAALYAEHGLDAPADSPKWSDAFDAALAVICLQ